MQKNYSKEFAGQFRSPYDPGARNHPGSSGNPRIWKADQIAGFFHGCGDYPQYRCDAVLAVYPFTPQPVITQAILGAADVPVFCGIGGGITRGKRVVNLAMDAEFKGAMGGRRQYSDRK